MKAIIVENEPKISRDFLGQIQSKTPEITVVAVAGNVDDALTAIHKHQPDVVFLDVELDNGETGFDLLKKIPLINFEIIFTTAYNKYALDAIKFSALDYLLKPVNDTELISAVAKVAHKNIHVQSRKMESLLAALAAPGSQQNRIPFGTMHGFEMVAIADIIYCEGESSQSTIMLPNKKKMVVTKTLKECEEVLVPYRFCRIHKSYLINLNHLVKYEKGQDGNALMSNGTYLTVSRNFKQSFLARVNSI